MPAFTAALRRREPLARNHKSAPVPLTFIFQAANNPAPPGLPDVTSETPVLLHCLHRKVFNDDHVPIFDETGSQFFDKVLAAVLDALSDLRYALALALPIVGAFLFSRELLLLFAEPPVLILKPAWIPDFLAGRKRGEAFDAEVYAYKLETLILPVDSRESLDLLSADKTNVILSGSVFRDGTAAWLGRKLQTIGLG